MATGSMKDVCMKEVILDSNGQELFCPFFIQLLKLLCSYLYKFSYNIAIQCKNRKCLQHTVLSQYTHCLRFSVCIGTI